MNTDVVYRLLTNSGFRILGGNGDALFIEDPSCILRSFQTFIEYAWVVICAVTALLIMGWAISMIRGSKNDIFTNLRNLTIIFATLGLAGPIVNVIWGGDLFARGCRQITVSVNEISKILDARGAQMTKRGSDLYEQIYIEDTGAIYNSTYNNTPQPMTVDEVPYSQSPLAAAGTPTTITATVSNNQDYVAYTSDTGQSYRRIGGSRSWRNKNPGNIRYSDFARRAGAIGTAGGFAVFPDEETGMQAIAALLRSNSYNKLTVAGAISRYAPPFENDTAAYHRKMKKLTGLSVNKRMADLNDTQLQQVVNAIRVIEGWIPGHTKNI